MQMLTATRVHASAAIPTAPARSLRAAWLVARQGPSCGFKSRANQNQTIAKTLEPELLARYGREKAANFRWREARKNESFSDHCVAPQVWSNSAVNYEFCRFGGPRGHVGLAHPKRVFHAHDAEPNGTALRSSTSGTRGVYNRRGAARTVQIRACFDVAERDFGQPPKPGTLRLMPLPVQLKRISVFFFRAEYGPTNLPDFLWLVVADHAECGLSRALRTPPRAKHGPKYAIFIGRFRV